MALKYLPFVALLGCASAPPVPSPADFVCVLVAVERGGLHGRHHLVTCQTEGRTPLCFVEVFVHQGVAATLVPCPGTLSKGGRALDVDLTKSP